MIIPEPEKKAVELIEKYCIDSPTKLNLEEIANAEYLIVEEIDTDAYLGKINFNEKSGLIKINRSIAEPGAKRFTLAHELGHFINEREKRFQKYACSFIDIYGKKIHENNANVFASELLMYKPWFGKFIKDRKVNMYLMKEIAEYFNVSLTAAALRYANIGKYPVAVILSRNSKVVWSYINEYFPYKWIPVGYNLREESYAYDYFQGKEVQTCDDLIPAHTWFSEDFKCPKDVYLNEQNVVMPNYGSVLTLLWKR